VYARTAGEADCVLSKTVVVEDEVEVGLGAPENLSTQAGLAVCACVGLPTVDDPRLNLQLLGWKILNTQAVEEPRRVRRNERGLVSPVVEVVVAEEANVGHEDSGVNIEPIVHVKVVAAVRFRYVFVGGAHIPLTHSGTGIVAHRCGGKHSEQHQDPATHVAGVKVSADGQILQLNFTVAENFAGPTHGVVSRLIEIDPIERIRSEFSAEVLRIERTIVLTAVPVEPGPIVVRKRSFRVHFRSCSGRWRSGGDCRLLRSRRS